MLPQTTLPELRSSCALIVGYTADLHLFSLLREVQRNSSRSDPNLILDLELEVNPYHVLFTSASAWIFQHILPAALYYRVAFAAFTELRSRARLDIPTPATIKAVLVLNLVMMVVLGSVIAADGYFISGTLPDEWAMPFRTLLLGWGTASSWLISQIWSDVLAGSGAVYGFKLKLCFAVAGGLVVVDTVCNLLLMRFWVFGGFALLVVVPLVLFCIELSNVVMFTTKAIRLLLAFDDMSKDDGGLSEAARRAHSFKRRTSRIVLVSAFCSGLMLACLMLMGVSDSYYSSPAAAFALGCTYIYAKVGVAACHVAICSRPRSRSDKDAPRVISGSLRMAVSAPSSHKVSPS